MSGQGGRGWLAFSEHNRIPQPICKFLYQIKVFFYDYIKMGSAIKNFKFTISIENRVAEVGGPQDHPDLVDFAAFLQQNKQREREILGKLTGISSQYGASHNLEY